jgi:hypothetical protein
MAGTNFAARMTTEGSYPLPEDGPWHNAYYNTLVAQLRHHIFDVDGSNIAYPLELDTEGQDLVGRGGEILRQASMFGSSGATGLIAATGWPYTGTPPTYAQGDNATDDTAEVLEALEGAYLTTLVIPPGRYIVTHASLAILLGSAWTNFKMMGYGGSSVIKKGTDNDDTILVGITGNSADIVIRDLTFDGNYEDSTDDVCLLSIAGGYRTLIDNCTFRNYAGIGIRIEGGARKAEVVIRNCRFEDYHSGDSYGAAGISVVNSSPSASVRNLVIEGCVFSSSGDEESAAGILLTSDEGDQVLGAMIRDCMFVGDEQYGVVFRADDYVAHNGIRDSVQISNNMFRGTTDMDYPIFVESLGTETSGSYVSTIRNVIISGNIMEGFQGVGILAHTDYDDDSVVKTHGLDIFNNIIDGQWSGTAGIQIGEGDPGMVGFTYSAIYSNLISNMAATTGYGIHVPYPAATGEVESLSIYGNMIWDDEYAMDYGVCFPDTSGRVNNVLVIANFLGGVTPLYRNHGDLSEFHRAHNIWEVYG